MILESKQVFRSMAIDKVEGLQRGFNGSTAVDPFDASINHSTAVKLLLQCSTTVYVLEDMDLNH
jgi:hypothetical protein